MAQSTFDGPIRSLSGIFQQGAGSVITITASAALNPTDHGGRILAVGGTLASNVVLTLPTINTTASAASAGPGYDPNTANNLGVAYTIWVPTTISTSSLKIGTDGTDKYVGYVLSIDSDTTDATRGFGAGASDDFINFNGTTTGGIAGTWVQIFALAALKYMVTGVAVGSSTVATPFATS